MKKLFINIEKLLLVIALGSTSFLFSMSYNKFNGNLSEQEALEIALLESSLDQKKNKSIENDTLSNQAATKIQALCRGWYQRKIKMYGAIKVLRGIRTHYSDGSMTTEIPDKDQVATFEGRSIPMSKLQRAKALFIRLGMTPFASVLALAREDYRTREIENNSTKNGYKGPENTRSNQNSKQDEQFK